MSEENPCNAPGGTCLAPVFPARDPCLCAILIIPGYVAIMGGLIALLLLGWVPCLWEIILCAILKLKFRIENCSKGNDNPCIELWRPPRLVVR